MSEEKKRDIEFVPRIIPEGTIPLVSVEGTPYDCEVYEGGEFTAVPASGSGLATYTMKSDGSVTREGGE